MNRVIQIVAICILVSCIRCANGGFAPGLCGGQVTSLPCGTVEQIYVGGNFTSYNGTSEPYIARLNADGSLDTSFAPVGTGFSNAVDALAFDSSGRLYAGGCFFDYNGTLIGTTTRLNPNGSWDPTFLLTGGGFNNCSAGLAITSSGKIMVDDGFQTYNGTTVSYAARLNSDGTLDTTFLPTGTGLSNPANSLAIDSSGKIVVGGTFTNYNGTNEYHVARLNTDGSLDATFTPTGTGLNNTVEAVAFDSSGKIVVGGTFTSYNGTNEYYVARLNTNGSLDAAFNPVGTGLNGAVQTLAIDSSGKIVVGGLFTSYNGTNEYYIGKRSFRPTFC